MNQSTYFKPPAVLLGLSAALMLSCAATGAEESKDAWWNTSWPQRSKVTFDTGTDAAGISDPTGAVTVMLRLSEANYPFDSGRDDGSDMRFVAADGKTLLPHQIEKYDDLLREATVWIRLPDAKPATKESFYVYYGNADASMTASSKPTDAYDENFSLIYHFGELGTAPADSTSNKNNAETPGATSEGALIGNGLRLSGTAPITITAKPSLQWQANQTATLTTWIKPSALQSNAVILSRREEDRSFRLLLDQGIPTLDIGGVRSQPGTPVAPTAWTHLAVVADGKNLRLFVNGTLYTQLAASLPALNTALYLGGSEKDTPTAGAGTPFVGELDEFTLSNTARPTSWIKLAAVTQSGSDAAQRTLSLGQSEGGEEGSHNAVLEHMSLFGDIAGNMMFDGWMAIGVCVIMIIVGWTVAIRKFVYLNSIDKGTKLFLTQWKSLSTDLTALDTEDASSVSSLGGQVEESKQSLVKKSPLFHIYQIGSDEIRHRLDKDNNRINGLSGRSIQAIRASLDAGLVHETHRLTDGLIYLTISIAGGPYVGLLGTVVGVMITFAIIAKSGEVNVNSIAPGIASALLATVVGLVVAIPALFIYSYLNSRIKNSLSLMQVFIDEFVAKMAEFYRPPNEPDAQQDKSAH